MTGRSGPVLLLVPRVCMLRLLPGERKLVGAVHRAVMLRFRSS